ncbi:hypothetical protein PS467_35040 [Streptomyces luomodiensis]|uniref:Uncharacterized protein n=1 Tax=Streptomyces luomodiensis TaxID=3026192 RepID=A0ABY9V5K1_9ACTN|nr:hypothetical protein [Streptomyces sp. SCA4-21]WNF00162.1 hypothetical protein PS467_35040 [Streptomyces sp. SCA4-21]
MNTAGTPDRAPSGQRLREVVGAVIAEVAPEELPVVAGLSRFDDDTVVARLTSRRRGREPLGFGLEEMVCLATPVVWVALDESVRKVIGRTVDGVPARVGRRLGRVFRRPSDPLVVPALTPEQVAEVRRRILELSARSGLEPERAEVLADRVAARLLLPVQADGTDGAGRTDDGAEGGEDDTDEQGTRA